jgi:hypothetical protein
LNQRIYRETALIINQDARICKYKFKPKENQIFAQRRQDAKKELKTSDFCFAVLCALCGFARDALFLT